MVEGDEIRRAADQTRDVLGDGVEHLAAGVARGDPLGVRVEGGNVLVPAVGQLARAQVVEGFGQVGIALAVSGEGLVPGFAQRSAAIGDGGVGVLDDPVGNQELGVFGPVVEPFGGLGLLRAQRLAVSLFGIGLGRRAIADDAVDDDQGRGVVGDLESLDRARQNLRVIGVGDVQSLPAIGAEPGRDVLGEGQGGVALDADGVAVTDPAEIGQLVVPGQRGRLA